MTSLEVTPEIETSYVREQLRLKEAALVKSESELREACHELNISRIRISALELQLKALLGIESRVDALMKESVF